jgi:hypothetical protein
MRHVAQLRTQGLTTVEINAQLEGKTFAVVESELQQTAQDAPPDAQEMRTGALSTTPVLSDLQTLLGPVLENRIARIEKAQRDGVIMFLLGFLASAAIFGLMLLLAVLFGR